MPGIVGIISHIQSAKAERLVSTMLGSMLHESSYLSGTCFVPELGIYAGWISHPGSFAAAENTINPQADLSLVFCGECFDEGGVKQEKPRLLERYRKEGPGFLKSLNGLFSGLVIDRGLKRALLFNDRFGAERLYVHETSDALYFASEAKALLRVLPETRSFDSEGISDFISYGCTLGWKTLFRGISIVPGGSCWTYSTTFPLRKEVYFSPLEWESQPIISASDFDTQFLEIFPRIFPKYTKSTGPLGISLTGGLDSRMVMACLPPQAQRPECYTYSGRTEKTLDTTIAARLAKASGANHHTIRIENDFLATFANQVDQTVYITDGCSGATGAHEIYYNRTGRNFSPIRLTGNFGSEVLRSVSTFKPIHLSPELFPRAGGSTMAPPVAVEHPVTFAAFREIPWSLFGPMAAGRSQVTFRTPYLDNELVALAFRAPPAVRTSPLPALRFLDHVHPDLARIPTDRGHIGTHRGPAWLLRRAFAEVTFKLDYMHTEGLPKGLGVFDPVLGALAPFGLLGLHKFLPYRRWFKSELRPYLNEVLTDRRTKDLPFLNSKHLDVLLANHFSGKANNVREINAVLTLEAIQRLLLAAT